MQAEDVEIGPANCRHEADAPAVRISQDEALALEQADAQPRAMLRQGRPCVVQFAPVEFMVAGDEQDRHRPAAKALKTGPGAVDVAAEHEQFRTRGGLGLEFFRLQVQVGQELQAHRWRLSAADF
jgi:hypothetical protein